MKKARKVMLPSVETQTLDFVAEARATGERVVARWLCWGGFRVYLRIWRNYEAAGAVLGEVLMIANVEVPERCRGRGCFKAYLELCELLGFDALLIESVVNKRLRGHLRKRADFVELDGNHFLRSCKTERLL